MGAHNIRGVDPGNTDWLIELFCSQGQTDDIHFGAYNVKTGEFRKEQDYIGKISRNRPPR